MRECLISRSRSSIPSSRAEKSIGLLIGSVIGVLVQFLAACAPAAPTQAPAQPTTAAQLPAAPAPKSTGAFLPTSAPAAIAPTLAPAATGLPELKPPPSGGVLNPPTVNPTTTASSSVPAGQSKQGWKTFRELALGLSFQYPQDWRQSTTRNSKEVVESILLAPSNQPVGNAAAILIDVRKKEGDLLPWLSKQLPTGKLLINAEALEGGANSYMNYNARLAGAPAVFLYAPAPITSTVPVAALHFGDDQYFYQFTYLGGKPDSLDDRAAFLRLLSTTMLSRTIQSELALPTTAFTKGIDLTKIK